MTMIEDFGPNGEYLLKRYDPTTFTLREAVDVYELDLVAFADTPQFLSILPKKFQYKSDERHLFELEPYDSLKRLKLRRDRQRAYEQILYFLAYRLQCNHSSMPGYVGYGLFTKDYSGNAQKLIGYCDFRYPEHMVKELIQELRPDSIYGLGWIKWTLYSYWLEFKFNIYNLYLKIRYWEHPFHNSRVAFLEASSQKAFEEKYPYDKNLEDKLSELDYDKLKKQMYPKEKTVYTMNFFIHPDYWGKGIGQRLFRRCIDLVPTESTPFVSKDKRKTSYGPQKFALTATDMGLHMYKKVGFVTVYDAIVKGYDNEDLSDIHMEYVRD